MIPFSREQIKALQGKQLNGLVAEHVMGWKPPALPWGVYWTNKAGTETLGPPCHSDSELGNPLEILLAMRHHGFSAAIHFGADVATVMFCRHNAACTDRNEVRAKFLNLALCRAALLALLEGGAT